MDNQNKRLFRSRKNRVFAGIAGGLGHYFNIDPTIIRLVLLLLFFFSGFPVVILYLVSMLFIPKQHVEGEHGDDKETQWLESRRGMLRAVLVAILFIVALGFLFWGAIFALNPWFWNWSGPMR